VDETSLSASRKCGVVLQPLAVFDIGLAPRNILDVVGIDQADFETFSLQHLIEGDPVNSGRFHDNRFDLASLEPLAEKDQVAGKYPEATHGTCISIFRHCHPMDIGSDVDSGSVEVHFLQLKPALGCAGFWLYLMISSAYLHSVQVR
jgi:hypothetical protein